MTTLEIVEILVRIAWLVGAVGFVIGLSRMNSPATARNGNLLSAGGMAIAIAATAILILVRQASGVPVAGIAWVIIVLGVAVGGGLGLYTARTVKMTAMPQLVSLFNAVGGGAAALIAIDDYLGLAAGSAVQIDTHIFIVLDIIIGSITFTGSIIASAMSLVRIAPEAPTRAPAMIRTGLLITKPAIATAVPVNEFSSEMTTGMSAPPIGSVIVTPNVSAAARITTMSSRFGVPETKRAIAAMTVIAARARVTSWPPGT